MRRASERSSKKSQRFKDDFPKTPANFSDFDSVSVDRLKTRKLRKIRDLQEDTRCHSVRCPTREPIDEEEIARPRSVSLVQHVPPVDAKLPLRKFLKLYSKVVVQLELVKSFTENKTNESENLVDLRRQLQRADEFSIRFSRNNLYETKRIINEIKRLIVPYPFEGLSPGNRRVLCRKIILAFQAANQALQTYINYAKNQSNLEVPEKANELVLIIAELFLCCEHVSLPLNDAYIKNDAVKICNDLIGILKSKIPVCEYVELKEPHLSKSKAKVSTDTQKAKKFSMYKTKLTNKPKAELPKKKVGIPCLLGLRSKKVKKDEKKAKITHEIYTQKLNPRNGRMFGSKNVKFETESLTEKTEIVDDKKNLRRPRYITPREVKSQDDDVETMVQTIGDDEISTGRFSLTSRGTYEEDLNKANFKHFLLETIEELQRADKKEQKITLKKLLNSIKNCPKSETPTGESERVRVYHFLSNDLLEEIKGERENQEKEKEEEPVKETVKEIDSFAKEKKTVPSERRLKVMFKQLMGKCSDDAGGFAPRGRIKLKLSEETMNNALRYRKAFAEYRRNNIMYRKTLATTPWELVGKVSDQIVLDIIKEISMDFENDALLKRLYLYELLEVTS